MIHARRQAGDLGETTARLLVERNTASDPEGVYWRTDPRLRYRSPIYITEEQVQAFLPCIQGPYCLSGMLNGLCQRNTTGISVKP